MKDERRKAEQPEVLVGIDVGSTTTKDCGYADRQ